MRISWRLICALSVITVILTGALGLFVSRQYSQAHAASPLPNQFFAPYYYLGEGASMQSVSQATGQKYFTLAFIVAPGDNNCQATWGGWSPLNQSGSNFPNLSSDLQYLRANGGDVIVSFGGAAGTDLAKACNSVGSLQAQYQAVIDTYNVSHLDFDVEGGTEDNSTTYTRRNTALAALQSANPGLTISFTLPADPNGVVGVNLLKDAAAKGVNYNIVNLMAMDYGSPNDHMGQSAIDTANAAYNQLKGIFPSRSSSQIWSMIGLTAMIGKNDTPNETFTLSDAAQVLDFANSKRLGELSFWAISRDNGSCPNYQWNGSGSLDTCSGIAQATYAFTKAWQSYSATSGTTPIPTPTTVASTPTPTPGTGGTFSGTYYITNRHSGKVLDVTDNSTANGAPIQQWSLFAGHTNQQWTFSPTGDGYFSIVSVSSGKVLDVTDYSTADGAKIQQWSRGNNQSNQQWSLQAVGNGYYVIVNRGSGKVLDDTGWSTSNGTIMQQWSKRDGQADQEWSLQQV